MDIDALASVLSRSRGARLVVVLGQGDYAAYRENSPTVERMLERESHRVVGLFTPGVDRRDLADACLHVERELYGSKSLRACAA